jgi:ABC-type siderophore export system fused ATPase/permease subunit
MVKGFRKNKNDYVCGGEKMFGIKSRKEKELEAQIAALRAEVEGKKELTEEEQIKKRIFDQAMENATKAYEKDVMFRTLQSSDFNYAIMQDLIRGAGMGVKIKITFADKTEVEIDSKSALDQLNAGDRGLF